MTPTEALKEWARERGESLYGWLEGPGLDAPGFKSRDEIAAALLSGVVKGLEAAKDIAATEEVPRADDAPEGVWRVTPVQAAIATAIATKGHIEKRIDALLKDLKERTT